MIITPKDDADRIDLARRLLEAAEGDASKVRTTFQGPTMAFEVDDETARAIGRTPDEEIDANAQTILRDTVGELGKNPVLPNTAPGTNDAADIPESPTATVPMDDGTDGARTDAARTDQTDPPPGSAVQGDVGEVSEAPSADESTPNNSAPDTSDGSDTGDNTGSDASEAESGETKRTATRKKA